MNDVCAAVQSALTPDLLRPAYRFMADEANPTAGHCYHAAEAAFHLLGGKPAGWVPHVHRGEDGITHWWLRRGAEIADPTADQYLTIGEQPPYDLGRACGFMTIRPSRPAAEIIRRVTRDTSKSDANLDTSAERVNQVNPPRTDAR